MYMAVEKALYAYSATCISRRTEWVCLGRTGVEHYVRIGLGNGVGLTPHCCMESVYYLLLLSQIILIPKKGLISVMNKFWVKAMLAIKV